MLHYRCLSLILIGVTLTLLPSWGQKSTHPRSLWAGAKGGVLLSRYNFYPSVAQSMRKGTIGGVAMRYEIEKGASLQAEFNYVQTGWKEKYDTESTSYSHALTYVELPLLTHLYLQSKSLRIFINAGPYVGYRLSEKATIGEDSSFSDSDVVRHEQPLSGKLAWGLTGGPGLSIRIAQRHRIELDGRLTYSFTDILPNHRVDPYGGSSELRIALTLNYLIKL